MSGYQKFKEAGAKLKPNPYVRMSEERLLGRKQTAEVWLQANQNHPQYGTAKNRYDNICRALMAIEFKKVMGI